MDTNFSDIQIVEALIDQNIDIPLEPSNNSNLDLIQYNSTNETGYILTHNSFEFDKQKENNTLSDALSLDVTIKNGSSTAAKEDSKSQHLDKVRLLKERHDLIRKKQIESLRRKQEEIREAMLRSDEFRKKQEEERRLRIDLLRKKEEERRINVEERRKKLFGEELERKQALLRKHQEKALLKPSASLSIYMHNIDIRTCPQDQEKNKDSMSIRKRMSQSVSHVLGTNNRDHTDQNFESPKLRTRSVAVRSDSAGYKRFIDSAKSNTGGQTTPDYNPAIQSGSRNSMRTSIALKSNNIGPTVNGGTMGRGMSKSVDFSKSNLTKKIGQHQQADDKKSDANATLTELNTSINPLINDVKISNAAAKRNKKNTFLAIDIKDNKDSHYRPTSSVSKNSTSISQKHKNNGCIIDNNIKFGNNELNLNISNKYDSDNNNEMFICNNKKMILSEKDCSDFIGNNSIIGDQNNIIDNIELDYNSMEIVNDSDIGTVIEVKDKTGEEVEIKFRKFGGSRKENDEMSKSMTLPRNSTKINSELVKNTRGLSLSRENKFDTKIDSGNKILNNISKLGNKNEDLVKSKSDVAELKLDKGKKNNKVDVIKPKKDLADNQGKSIIDGSNGLDNVKARKSKIDLSTDIKSRSDLSGHISNINLVDNKLEQKVRKPKSDINFKSMEVKLAKDKHNIEITKPIKIRKSKPVSINNTICKENIPDALSSVPSSTFINKDQCIIADSKISSEDINNIPTSKLNHKDSFTGSLSTGNSLNAMSIISLENKKDNLIEIPTEILGNLDFQQEIQINEAIMVYGIETEIDDNIKKDDTNASILSENATSQTSSTTINNKEPPKKLTAQDTLEAKYKSKLAENRRLAREKAEKEAEEERLRIEEEKRLEELRIQREEEEQRRQEQYELELVEEARLHEIERLRVATEEASARRKADVDRLELEKKEKLEAELRAIEENERKEREKLEKLRKDEEERIERKKKLESIMKRVNHTKMESSSMKSDISSKENFSEKVIPKSSNESLKSEVSLEQKDDAILSGETKMNNHLGNYDEDNQDILKDKIITENIGICNDPQDLKQKLVMETESDVLNNKYISEHKLINEKTSDVLNNAPIFDEMSDTQTTYIINNPPILEQKFVAEKTTDILNNPPIDMQTSFDIINNPPILVTKFVGENTSVIFNDPLIMKEKLEIQTSSDIINNPPIQETSEILNKSPIYSSDFHNLSDIDSKDCINSLDNLLSNNLQIINIPKQIIKEKNVSSDGSFKFSDHSTYEETTSKGYTKETDIDCNYIQNQEENTSLNLDEKYLHIEYEKENITNFIDKMSSDNCKYNNDIDICMAIMKGNEIECDAGGEFKETVGNNSGKKFDDSVEKKEIEKDELKISNSKELKDQMYTNSNDKFVTKTASFSSNLMGSNNTEDSLDMDKIVKIVNIRDVEFDKQVTTDIIHVDKVSNGDNINYKNNENNYTSVRDAMDNYVPLTAGLSAIWERDSDLVGSVNRFLEEEDSNSESLYTSESSDFIDPIKKLLEKDNNLSVNEIILELGENSENANVDQIENIVGLRTIENKNDLAGKTISDNEILSKFEAKESLANINSDLDFMSVLKNGNKDVSPLKISCEVDRICVENSENGESSKSSNILESNSSILINGSKEIDMIDRTNNLNSVIKNNNLSQVVHVIDEITSNLDIINAGGNVELDKIEEDQRYNSIVSKLNEKFSKNMELAGSLNHLIQHSDNLVESLSNQLNDIDNEIEKRETKYFQLTNTNCHPSEDDTKVEFNADIRLRDKDISNIIPNVISYIVQDEVINSNSCDGKEDQDSNLLNSILDRKINVHIDMGNGNLSEHDKDFYCPEINSQLQKSNILNSQYLKKELKVKILKDNISENDEYHILETEGINRDLYNCIQNDQVNGNDSEIITLNISNKNFDNLNIIDKSLKNNHETSDNYNCENYTFNKNIKEYITPLNKIDFINSNETYTRILNEQPNLESTNCIMDSIVNGDGLLMKQNHYSLSLVKSFKSSGYAADNTFSQPPRGDINNFESDDSIFKQNGNNFIADDLYPQPIEISGNTFEMVNTLNIPKPPDFNNDSSLSTSKSN